MKLYWSLYLKEDEKNYGFDNNSNKSIQILFMIRKVKERNNGFDKNNHKTKILLIMRKGMKEIHIVVSTFILFPYTVGILFISVRVYICRYTHQKRSK